ncbi:RNA polymerase sigma factor [Swaminathania salitolerans]|uniref:RNA polymerase sigma factor n=1 Tax=Swaminathania salitolerans TaxID=182838 RepID=UPI0011BFDA73|nr:sigma-70 family RNA polymerase sigma factor [Swaminathania salitolerans]GBQ10924.1 RNA polymerase sigma-24 factor [Swaminathania salitolerans LMG 21291]
MSVAEWRLGHAVWISLHNRLRSSLRRSDTDDLLQTALLHLFERGLDGITHPEAYILRAARNLAIDRARRERCIAFSSLDEASLPEAACSQPGPERIVLGREQLARVKSAFLALDARTARIFFLHRMEGVSYSQIAIRMKVSVSTVEKAVARAVSGLALALIDPAELHPSRAIGR